MASSASCPSDNAQVIDQSTFWDSNGIDWDTHRIGWVISGACAAATLLISTVSVMEHCLHYHNPAEQRQILRILYMPPVYAIISFFSYRFFRSYTYYDLIETAYENLAQPPGVLLRDIVEGDALGGSVVGDIDHRSIALYGLLLFYGLTKDELKGKRPLAKFLSIKLIVMFTFYQSFVFSALEGHVIKGTKYWTEANVADGLNALAICIEMVFFSAFMLWAFPWKEYKHPNKPLTTNILRPLWDSINYSQ
ncbi:hypothetical protein EW026_g1986 [Hermanssonia centrifuga]|uniref:Uncharacterized protein n=1 Tax=Hermanssonia centrifuga TaxID=98765 RepID=A0A4S4KQM3_9APHY|nr:hypothetical protein EW026_g1986 [Hermanssonia centrifuga]